MNITKFRDQLSRYVVEMAKGHEIIVPRRGKRVMRAFKETKS